MSLAMSQHERKAFLAEPHVGVIAINDTERGPLATPIWYDYTLGEAVTFLVSYNSRKIRLLREGSVVTFLVQQETMPYKYVCVEGPVSISPSKPGALLEMARRYLPEEQAQDYANQSAGDGKTVSLDIKRWLTVDYGKEGW
ncbi:MAG: pyridoxamine 5'-phosphate oxidase family protein [Pseudomonadota bacterium]